MLKKLLSILLVICLLAGAGTGLVYATDKNAAENEYDVVVVGGGMAGLSAAVAASENGAEVVLLEKLSFLGGNSLLSTGVLYLGGTSLQVAAGIEDSPDAFYEDSMKDSGNKRDEVQTRLMADHGGEVIDWLIACGVEFSDEITAVIGGSPTPRAHRSLPNAGGLINAMQEKAESIGVTIMFETPATKIIEKDGAVVGVIAKTKDGEEIELFADSVIIAAGGYGADYDRLVKFTPAAEGLLYAGASGTTGEMLEQMIELGAKTIDLEETWITPTIETERKLLLTSLILSSGAILVDDQGNRYTNEMQAYSDISADSLALGIDHQVEIFDSQVKDLVYKVPEYVEMGMVHEVESIEELAEAAGLPVENLKATIDDYNAVARGEKKDAFGRELVEHEINVPPYYYATVSPGTILTPGGVAINENCQVVDKDGEVIEGLYATGETTGGYRAFGYRGGDALAHAAVTGYVAGKAASGK